MVKISPSSSYVGIVSITISASNTAGESTATLVLNLVAPIQKPSITIPVISNIVNNTTQTITLSYTNGGDTLANTSITITSIEPAGLQASITSTTASNFVVRIRPSTSYVGIVSITISASNTAGATTAKLVLNIVAPAIQKPSITIPVISNIVNNTTQTITLSYTNGGDTLANTSITITSIEPAGLQASITSTTASNFVVRIRPSTSYVGIVSITISASNTAGDSTAKLVLNIVAPAIQKPSITIPVISNIVNNTTQTITLSYTNGGDTLANTSITITSIEPAGLQASITSTTASNFVVRIRPSTSYVGIVSITISASNTAGDSTAKLVLNIVAPAIQKPSITIPVISNIVNNTTQTITLSYTNGGDTLANTSITITSIEPAGLQASITSTTASNFVVALSPSTSYVGIVSITISASNTAGATTATLVLNLVKPIIKANITIPSVSDIANNTTQTITLSYNNGNDANTSITITSIEPAGLQASITSTTASNFVVVLSPSSSYVGIASITILASNTAGQTTKTLVLNLVAPIQKPSITILVISNIANNTTRTITVNYTNGGDTLANTSITISSIEPRGLQASITSKTASNFVVVLSPSSSYVGIVSITISASNTAGATTATLVLNLVKPKIFISYPTEILETGSANIGISVNYDITQTLEIVVLGSVTLSRNTLEVNNITQTVQITSINDLFYTGDRTVTLTVSTEGGKVSRTIVILIKEDDDKLVTIKIPDIEEWATSLYGDGDSSISYIEIKTTSTIGLSTKSINTVIIAEKSVSKTVDKISKLLTTGSSLSFKKEDDNDYGLVSLDEKIKQLSSITIKGVDYVLGGSSYTVIEEKRYVLVDTDGDTRTINDMLLYEVEQTAVNTLTIKFLQVSARFKDREVLTTEVEARLSQGRLSMLSLDTVQATKLYELWILSGTGVVTPVLLARATSTLSTAGGGSIEGGDWQVLDESLADGNYDAMIKGSMLPVKLAYSSIRSTTATGDIKVTARANKKKIYRGGILTYEVELENITRSTITYDIGVLTQLPRGLRYLEGSAQLRANGRKILLKVEDKGKSILLPLESGLEFKAGEKYKLYYQVTVGTGANLGSYDTLFTAGRYRNKKVEVKSNTAKVVIKIVADPLFDLGTIIGKVFNDVNGNGVQDKGDLPLSKAKLITESGILVTTDKYGRYHIGSVKPGVHMLKILGLPKGTSYINRRIQIIRVSKGMTTKVNFAIRLDPSLIKKAYKKSK